MGYVRVAVVVSRAAGVGASGGCRGGSLALAGSRVLDRTVDGCREVHLLVPTKDSLKETVEYTCSINGLEGGFAVHVNASQENIHQMSTAKISQSTPDFHVPP